jgi:hypothetical protein
LPLDPPARDASGLALPHDHPQITGDDFVVRRISRIAARESVVPAKDGSSRLSSAIFTASSRESDPYEGISVDLDEVAQQEGIDLRSQIEMGDFLGAVCVSAARVRNEELSVGYDPEPTNICHGQIWGKPANKKRKRLLRSCAWYVEINGVSLDVG